MRRLRELRLEKGLTILQVSLELEVSHTTIQQYETGTNEPNIAMLIKLADFYGVTIDYLVGRSPVRGPLTDEDEALAYQLRHLKNSTAKQAAITLLGEVREEQGKKK